MTQPPTLSYAPPLPPPRGLTAAFALLIILSTLYTGAILFIGYDLVTRFSPDLFRCLNLSIAAISTAIFVTAAIRIRRHTYRWALIAFITALANLAALFSCLGYAFISNPRADDATINCCIYSIPFALLTILAQILFTLLRNLKQSP